VECAFSARVMKNPISLIIPAKDEWKAQPFCHFPPLLDLTSLRKRVEATSMKRLAVGTRLVKAWSMSSTIRLGHLLAMLVLLSGCNSLNPLCGSTRPVPVLTSVSPTTIAFSQLPATLSLILTGSQFVSSSVVVFNGTTLPTTVNSKSQLTATVTSSLITGPGSYSVQVQTPAGNSGDFGCSSGGKSTTLTLSVT
jgi:hypothetical protein